MIVHKNPRWERLPEKIRLEVDTVERFRANPLSILAELNDAVVELIITSMGKEYHAERRLEELRKVLNTGRRDI
jgi:hypothetical protein